MNTGRNRSSVEPKNSALSYALRARNVVPSSSTHDAPDEIAGGLGDEHIAVQLGRQSIAAIDHGRARGRHLHERAVGRSRNAELVRSIGAGIGPDRPDLVDVVGVVRQHLVAAARSNQRGIARVVRRRHRGRPGSSTRCRSGTFVRSRPDRRPIHRATASDADRTPRPSSGAST